MSTRNFIRHLEPYGYIDQNSYDASVCHYDVDLSDLCGSAYTASQNVNDRIDDINERIDDLCERQSSINNEFARKISANTCNISALTDALNDVACKVSTNEENISANSAAISALEDSFSGMSEDIATLFAQDEFISGVVQNALQEIDTKANRCELENYYTKEETYDKNEVDALISGINNALDAKADLEYVDAISAIVETLGESVETKASIEYVDEKDVELKAYADDTFETKADAEVSHNDLNGKIDNEINRASEKEEELTSSVSALTDDIIELSEKEAQDVVDLESADAAANERIDGVVNDLAYVSGVVDTKVGVSDFDNYKASAATEFATTNANIADLHNNMANVRDLAVVSGAVDDVADDLAQEVNNRTAADGVLQGNIDVESARVNELSASTALVKEDVDALEVALAQEISDRTEGDTALIGSSSDASSMDTINAAKKYAQEVGNTILTDANTFTNEKITETRNTLSEYIEQEISSCATNNDLVTESNNSRSYTDEKVSDEAVLREEKDNEILDEINAYRDSFNDDVSGLTQALNHTANVLGAVTSWDNETPEGYTDNGNGILDVLHREFHEFVVSTNTRLNDLTNRVIDLEHRIQ